MCLYVYPDMRLPDGLGNLVSIEELKSVKVRGTDEIEKELGKLVELRVLPILWEAEEDERVCESLLVSLGNLQKLCSLKLGGCKARCQLGRLGAPSTPPHI